MGTRRDFIAIASLALAICFTRPPAANAQTRAGAVFTLTNAANANAVVAYRRAADGSLTYQGRFLTGGRGSGGTIDPLQSQDSLVLSDDKRYLFTVNAGSGDISSLYVSPFGLILVDKAPCGGALPVSLAVHKNLLYVLNSGGNGNITGFTIRPGGRLAPIAGSTQPLSAASAGGADIKFSPDGRLLAVTERLTNLVLTYPVGADGRAGAPIRNPSSGSTPFSLAFTPPGDLLVAEAFGGPPTGDAAVSSYAVETNGSLRVITGSAPTLGTAACWIVVTRDGRYAYTSNAGSGTISGFGIGRDGSLTLLNPDDPLTSTGPGSTPLDIALSRDSRYFYTLNAGAGTISAFRVEANGSLTLIETEAEGPAPASGQNGLVAY